MKYVLPHQKISRDVREYDRGLILNAAQEMVSFCKYPPKNHAPALAIAHSQVEEVEPLRFFVTGEAEIIANPVITRHTNHTYPKQEGCTTFDQRIRWANVERWQKLEVEYETVEEYEWVKKTESVSGKRAQMFQHEIDHMDGKYIYEINWEGVEKQRAE